VADLAAPEVTDEDRHHLARVLRLAPGERVVAADGAGAYTVCRYTGSDPLLEPEGPPVRTARPAPAITVAFAPAKGDRPEWVVQKLTELGVDRIVPITADRSVVRWHGARAGRAAERLARVAREAAAQSRRAWLPEVAAPTTLAELAAAGSLVLADPDGEPPSLRHPAVAVGPEGGWSDEERALGFATVRLGDATLRAETAAVTAGALLTALRSSLVGPAAGWQG